MLITYVVNLFKGLKNSTVELTVFGNNDKPVKKIVRKEIKIKTVSWAYLPNGKQKRIGGTTNQNVKQRIGEFKRKYAILL